VSCSAGGVLPLVSAQLGVWQSLQPPTMVRYWPAAESLDASSRGVPDEATELADALLPGTVFVALAMHAARRAEAMSALTRRGVSETLNRMRAPEACGASVYREVPSERRSVIRMFRRSMSEPDAAEVPRGDGDVVVHLPNQHPSHTTTGRR
jgi:hypothetical protein